MYHTPFENQCLLKLSIQSMYVFMYTQTLIREKKAKELKGKETTRYKTGPEAAGSKECSMYTYNTYNLSPARVPLGCSEKEEMCYDFTS